MKKSHTNYLGKCILWMMALIGLFALTVYLLLPYAINLQSVRNRIKSQAARAIGMDVDFLLIEPVLLPTPRLTVNRFNLTAPGNISVQVHQAVIEPRIRSLLSGHLQLDRLVLVEPHVVVHRPETSKEVSLPPAGVLRKQVAGMVTAVAGALGRFEGEIIGGRITEQRTRDASLLATQLNARFQTDKDKLQMDIQGRSPLAARFHLKGRIDTYTLDSSGSATITGVRTDMLKAIGLEQCENVVPDMVLDLEISFASEGFGGLQTHFAVRTPTLPLVNGARRWTVGGLVVEGKGRWTSRKADITISKLTAASPAIQMNGSFRWSKSPSGGKLPIEIAWSGTDLDLFEIRDGLSRLYGNHPVVRNVLDIVRGGTVPVLSGSTSAAHWSGKALLERLRIECDVVDGRFRVPSHDFLDLRDVNGRVVIAQGRLEAHDVAARMARASSKKGSLVLGLYDRSRVFRLDTLIDADVAGLPAVLKQLIKDRAHLSMIERLPPFAGRVAGRLTLGDRLDRIAASITASSHIKTQDSALNLTVSIDDLPTARTVAKIFVKGRMGGDVTDWLWRQANAPPELIPRPPLAVEGADIIWKRSGALYLTGHLKGGNGMRATAALAAKKDDIHLKRLHIRSATSDARISMRRRQGGDLLDVGFQGYLDQSTVDQLLRENSFLGGWLKGDLQTHVDHRKPANSTVGGHVAVRDLTVPLVGRTPVRITTGSAGGTRHRFTISSVGLKWEDQNMRVSGQGRFASSGLDLALRADARSLNAKKLAPLFNSLASGAQPRPEGANTTMGVGGRIKVDIDQLDYHRYRLAPFQADIEQRDRQTWVRISSAGVCGIQLPGHIHLSEAGTSMEIHPMVARAALKDAGSCLLDVQHTERIDGRMDLTGRITTTGRTNQELVSNLEGRVHVRVEDGRVYNVGSAGLFTNLLSFLSINQYASGDLPNLSTNDFRFNRIDSQLVFHDGRVHIKEGVVKSNAMNMAADGQYHIASRELDLKMLVSPLTTVDWIIERIPIFGNILGGTLVAIPVSVKGHQSNPRITPLALSAVGSRLGGILERALKTPIRIVEPLLKSPDKSQ